MENKIYESPQVEIIEVAVEAGIAQSGDFIDREPGQI